jgi:queuine tRNA-ribosyltransferase
MSFSFELHATDGPARAGTFHTPHGPIATPAFMPVGTLGNVKTVTPDELQGVGASMILANTYHLYLRPGHELVRELGGLHAFMRWDGPILTDSGGFQVFSLGKIREIKDDGVVFQSHIDGSKHLFTPEGVMEIQRALGADVIMAFDECPPGGSDRSVVMKANERTLRWLERCRTRFGELQEEGRGGPVREGESGSGSTLPVQSLFPIVQGNIYPDLRMDSLRGILGMGEWDGVAIGGLSVGEPKPATYDTLAALHPHMPADRPRYLMGVGYPDDLVEAVARGCDMFDCVAPTRNARHGTAWTSDGQVNLKARRFDRDRGPIDEGCDCATCARFDRAYLRHLVACGEALGHRLITVHNLRFLTGLMERARENIQKGRFAGWSAAWLERYRSNG